MRDAVRGELIDLVQTGGRSLCAMPRVLLSMLRERCPGALEAVSEIEGALEIDLVTKMLNSVGPIDTAGLAAELSERTGKSIDRSEWIIDSWAAAIDAIDKPPSVAADWSAWNALAVKKERTGNRQIFALAAAALAGAVGTGISQWFESPAWRDAVEGLPAAVGSLAVSVLACLGGGTGGGLGWMATCRLTGSGHGGTDSGRGKLLVGCLGAAAGAAAGGSAGLELFGLAGVMFGSLLGALTGQLFTAAVVQLLSRLRS